MKTKINYLFAILLVITTFSCAKDGETGPEGPEGPRGIEGPQGIPGKDGNLIHHGDQAPTVSLGEVGDYFIDKANGNLYGPKTESGWGTPVSLQGPQGDKGDKGDAGSQFLSGTTQPNAGHGKPGDFYFRTTTGELFGPKNADHTWPTGINLKGERGEDGNANVMTYRFTVKREDWTSTPTNFGYGNLMHHFIVEPELVGGVDLQRFFDRGGLIIAYAKPQAPSNYYDDKILPYTYARTVNGNNFGVKIELAVRHRQFRISKTTNGWDSHGLTQDEMPEEIRFRVTLIESEMVTHMKNAIDIDNPNAVRTYLLSRGVDL